MPRRVLVLALVFAAGLAGCRKRTDAPKPKAKRHEAPQAATAPPLVVARPTPTVPPSSGVPVLVSGSRPVAPTGVTIPPRPVVLELVVGESGAVETVRVVNGISPALDALAVEAVRKWVYRPAVRGGRAVAATVTESVTFRKLV